ncbi:MAG: hypothetical protein KGL39_15705 [Patescibacteria group bacterium]|nr:hypothetical protein [Patescibacteria group bacterium]
MSEHHWISSAIKHHGVFRAAAQRAGMSTEAFARKHEKSAGIMGQRARLALTLMGLHHHDQSQTEESDFKRDVQGAVKRHMKA